MISRKRDVIFYLEKNQIFKDYKIISVKSGLSNKNYIIESEGKKYIVRFNKKKPSNSINILEYEHHLLKFLETKNFDFVPKSLFYDKEENVHILTYIEGRKIRFKNISSRGMDQAIRKLHQINILAGEYDLYCKIKKIKHLRPHSDVEGIRARVLKKIEIIEADNVYYDYKKWILDRLEKDFMNYSPNKDILFLNHGDPADNLIIHDKEISIIDWEYVKITYGPGLVHILAHGRLDPEKEERLLRMYAKISEMDYAELYRKTYTEKMIYYLLKTAKLLVKTEEPVLENKKNIENLMRLYANCQKRIA